MKRFQQSSNWPPRRKRKQQVIEDADALNHFSIACLLISWKVGLLKLDSNWDVFHNLLFFFYWKSSTHEATIDHWNGLAAVFSTRQKLFVKKPLFSLDEIEFQLNFQKEMRCQFVQIVDSRCLIANSLILKQEPSRCASIHESIVSVEKVARCICETEILLFVQKRNAKEISNEMINQSSSLYCTHFP